MSTIKEKMKMILLILALCQVSECQIQSPITTEKPYDKYISKLENKDLGFVMFDRNITVGKNIEKYSVGVMIKVESSLETYRNAMTKLYSDITRLGKVPILKATSGQTLPLKLLFDNIKLKQTMIEHQFKQISTYSNAKNERNIDELNACKLTIPVIAANEVEVIIDDLISSVMDLDENTKPEDVSNGTEGKQLYLSWVYALYHYEKTLESLWEKTNTRLIMLENLNSHIIPDRLPLMLVGTTCSNAQGRESLDVLECEKTPKGLYCQISIKSQVKSETMQRYTMINYNGIELALPIEGAFLVKINEKTWGILKCEYDEFTTTDLDEFADCRFINYHNPCTENILEQKIDPILKNCNFTYKTPHIATLTAEGTLIQGKYVSAKEIEPTTMKTLAILKEKPPFFISTNAWLMVSDDSKEQIIKPEKVYENRILSTTWMSEHDLSNLEQKTKIFHIIEKTESGTIIDVIMGIILLIMAPGTIYFLKLCIEGIKISKGCCRKKLIEPGTQKNYRDNKRILVK